LRWKWDQVEPFGVTPANENPASLGAFELPLRFPGQYADREINLSYNYFRSYDPVIGRFQQADPLGIVLPGTARPSQKLNQPYAYADSNSLGIADPWGLCPCNGGVWDQDTGDFQFNVGGGGYFSIGNVNFTCRSDPSLKCSGKQMCVGAGTPNIGVSWAIGGVQFGATDTRDLSGWSGGGVFSGWYLGAQGGFFQGQISLSGQGGGTAAGLPRGISASLSKCLAYQIKCNCPSCPSQ
jgi:RHS repeat-associated protein